MSEQVRQANKRRCLRFRQMRDLVAVSLWTFALTKVAVFDVDIYLLERAVPSLHWVLGYKLSVLMAGTAALWVWLGHRTFLVSAAYVIGFPLVVLAWKLPKHAFRRWPLVVVFGPGLYRAAVRLRSTLVIYTVAVTSVLVVARTSRPTLLIAAMFGMGLFVVAHLYRSFRNAYSASPFSELARLAREFRGAVEGAQFDPETVKVQSATAGAEESKPEVMVGLYVFHSFVQFVADKVQAVARRRHYDLYLTASWLYTVFVTSVGYAFEYWALHKLTPDVFSRADGASFWSFLGFSLSILTSTGLSPINPSGDFAIVLSYSEVGCSILILVTLVFSVLTAAREAFRDDVQEFTAELRRAAEAFERRAIESYRLTLAQLESIIFEKTPELVNWLRKAQGFPELAPPLKLLNKATRQVSLEGSKDKGKYIE